MSDLQSRDSPPGSRGQRLAAIFRQVAADRRGDVAMIFGLMSLVMLLVMGTAVDYGRWLHARSQTQTAIDSAVLAAGRALQLNPSNETAAIAMADKYYAENVRSRIELASDTITFKIVDNGLAITADGEAHIATTLLALAGIETLALFEASGAEYSKAKLAIGSNAGVNLEIALMLDTSGSMDSNNKMEDMQEAAADLVNIIVWEDQSEYTSKVSVAPFSADMRLPASANAAARGSSPAPTVTYSYTCGSKKKGFGTCTAEYDLTACVAERTGAEAYTDAAPGAGKYVLPVYTSSGSCSQPEDNALMPLSSDKTALINKIESLDIGGGTAGHLGTAWAWYTLSPDWNSLWASSGAQASDYGAPKTQKIAILMTDGEYNTQYDAQGVKTGSSGAGSAANSGSTAQARALCDGMKAKDITVYTVGFDLGGNETAIDTLEYCATDAGKFYNADDGDELKQAFRDIALQLSQLFLSR